MLPTSIPAIVGFGLIALGVYSTVRTRRDHAAYRAENARRQLVDGHVARYQYSSISNDSGPDTENYRPIVTYVFGGSAYEIPMPSGDRFSPGEVGQRVPVAVDPGDPAGGRFLTPRDHLAVYSSVAVAVGGLVLVVTEWLDLSLF